jgi:hypothetical protein
MLGVIISMVASIFGKGTLGSITKNLRGAYRDRLNAKNNVEQRKYDERIAFLESRKALLLKELDSKMTSWIRPAYVLPFVIYNFKIVVWDKVLGWGVTDPLDEKMWYISSAIIGFYFLIRPLEKRNK